MNVLTFPADSLEISTCEAFLIDCCTPVLSIFKCDLNFGLNVLPEFEVLTEFNSSLNVNLNFKYCLVPKWE